MSPVHGSTRVTSPVHGSTRDFNDLIYVLYKAYINKKDTLIKVEIIYDTCECFTLFYKYFDGASTQTSTI